MAHLRPAIDTARGGPELAVIHPGAIIGPPRRRART
jgi:hypothetical protein